MGRNKQPTWGDSIKTVLKFAGWMLFIACVLAALGGRVYAAKNFNVPAYWGYSVDSAKVFIRYKSAATILDSTAGAARTGVMSYDTTVSLAQDDSSYYVEVRLWNTGVDSGATWAFARDVPSVTIAGGYIDSNKSEQGGIAGASLTFGVYATDGTDSVDNVLLTLQNASGATKAVSLTNSSGYGEFTVTSGSWIVLGEKALMTFSDSTYSVTGNDTVLLVGADATIPTPSDPALATVFGYIKDPTTATHEGIVVMATRTGGINATNSTPGSEFTVTLAAPPVATDTSGYWHMDLMRTGQYPDTSQGFYNIIGTFDGEEVFRLNKLWIPSSGNVWADTVLGNR